MAIDKSTVEKVATLARLTVAESSKRPSASTRVLREVSTALGPRRVNDSLAN